MRVEKRESGRVPVKFWTDGVEMQQEAVEQLHRVAELPFVRGHIAAMPDVHWGIGATVGSVIPFDGAIVPAAVGVDIGCGMVARKLPGVTANRLPDNLEEVRAAIEAVVPVGFALNTLFYGAVVWCFFWFAPRTLRRHLRARRGLCPTCGYPVGEAAVCSECGARIQPARSVAE